MLDGVSLDQLRTFVAAAEEGNFSAAGRRLRRAQSVVSQTLANLEGQIGVKLFDRSGRIPTLTDQGHALLADARAVAINEKTLGPDHVAVAVSLGNLATLLQDQGDFEGARPLLERALGLAESALGSEHPNTNRVRSNLAKALVAIGNFADAEKLGAVALALHESALGPSHAWTVDAAAVVAQALEAAGRSGEAAQVRQRFGLDQPALQRWTG